jgi:hypothetical protein
MILRADRESTWPARAESLRSFACFSAWMSPILQLHAAVAAFRCKSLGVVERLTKCKVHHLNIYLSQHGGEGAKLAIRLRGPELPWLSFSMTSQSVSDTSNLSGG